MDIKKVYKCYCPKCKRFMFKFIEDNNAELFIKCINCKNVSGYRITNKKLYTVTLGERLKVEPNGVITPKEIESIFREGDVEQL